MNELTPIGRALQALGIPFQEFRHIGPVSSLEQAAAEREQRPEQVVRSILFRLAQDDYLMVLVGGPKQVNWKLLRKVVGHSRMTMATPDEVRAVTGYEIGAVAPFALPQPVRVLLDESVMSEDVISLGSGVRGTAVILTTADLARALGDVERVSVVQSSLD